MCLLYTIWEPFYSIPMQSARGLQTFWLEQINISIYLNVSFACYLLVPILLRRFWSSKQIRWFRFKTYAIKKITGTRASHRHNRASHMLLTLYSWRIAWSLSFACLTTGDAMFLPTQTIFFVSPFWLRCTSWCTTEFSLLRTEWPK